MTSAIYCAINGITYWALKTHKEKKDIEQSKSHVIAFAYFETNKHKAE